MTPVMLSVPRFALFPELLLIGSLHPAISANASYIYISDSIEHVGRTAADRP